MLTPDAFRPHVGTTFSIDVQGGDPLVLTLDEVQVRSEHELRAEPFTLSFSGPAEPMAPQGTFRLEHDELGSLEVFLVPVEAGRYEAVFN